MILLFVVGCSNGQTLTKYNHDQLSEDLKKEGIDPKLPTRFPMAVKDAKIQMPPHKSAIYSVMFNGGDGEVFDLRIHSGDVTFEGDFEKEEVKINGKDGFYTEDKAGLDVNWKDGDYFYILSYQTIGLDTEVTKETMIEIAESFR
ncbi:DUF4367 domain-containing protein [Bacillus sp. NTK074B]|uniref:DUF4367 domain-containing protein n=1 Tax=Bacillus sp. NTK074B TaxID=2802174 RepID=UPI001A8DDC8F|nr:DUF4367 domain-containing protein [Bacillus sp. NTK074B]